MNHFELFTILCLCSSPLYVQVVPGLLSCKFVSHFCILKIQDADMVHSDRICILYTILCLFLASLGGEGQYYYFMCTLMVLSTSTGLYCFMSLLSNVEDIVLECIIGPGDPEPMIW